jgi:hypothetical protein
MKDSLPARCAFVSFLRALVTPRGIVHPATMTCDHHWIIILAEVPPGVSFHAAYRCGKCGLVVGVCQAGIHPFGFPNFRGRQTDCAWCSPGEAAPPTQ